MAWAMDECRYRRISPSPSPKPEVARSTYPQGQSPSLSVVVRSGFQRGFQRDRPRRQMCAVGRVGRRAVPRALKLLWLSEPAITGPWKPLEASRSPLSTIHDLATSRVPDRINSLLCIRFMRWRIYTLSTILRSQTQARNGLGSKIWVRLGMG